MDRESIVSYHILSHIEKDDLISQRKLSKKIGLNISSINYSLKKLISRGYVKMQGISPRQIKYHLTPQGVSEKTQLAYKYFIKNYHLYQDLRSDILSKIEKIDKKKGMRIVVCGVTPYFEIIYAILIEYGFEIKGIVDDSGDTNRLSKNQYKDISNLKPQDIDFIVELKDMSDILKINLDWKNQDFESVERVNLFSD